MANDDIVIVGVSMSDEDVVKCDEEGKKLRFDEENFKELPKDVVEKLSSKTKRDYFLAYGMWMTNNDVSKGEVEEEMIVSPEQLRLQNTMMLDVKVKDNLKGYHATPQQVEKLKRQGFRIATNNDLADDNTGSRHVKVGGYTDNILMVRPKELSEKYRKEKKERNYKLRTGKSLEEGKSELNKLGMENFSEFSETKEEVV